jgi:hypothetical protein
LSAGSEIANTSPEFERFQEMKDAVLLVEMVLFALAFTALFTLIVQAQSTL